jgi:uncharacterized membrane protein YfcA
MAGMSRDLKRRDRISLGGVIVGVAGMVIGVGGVTGLVALLNCETSLCNTWAVHLGLTGATLVSAVFQLSGLIGAWLVWRATHRRE